MFRKAGFGRRQMYTFFPCLMNEAIAGYKLVSDWVCRACSQFWTSSVLLGSIEMTDMSMITRTLLCRLTRFDFSVYFSNGRISRTVTAVDVKDSDSDRSDSRDRWPGTSSPVSGAVLPSIHTVAGVPDLEKSACSCYTKFIQWVPSSNSESKTNFPSISVYFDF